MSFVWWNGYSECSADAVGTGILWIRGRALIDPYEEIIFNNVRIWSGFGLKIKKYERSLTIP